MKGTPTLPSLLETSNLSKLARVVGVSRNTIHRWSNGSTLPQAKDLTALAAALHMDVGALATIIANDAKRLKESDVAEAAV